MNKKTIKASNFLLRNTYIFFEIYNLPLVEYSMFLKHLFVQMFKDSFVLRFVKIHFVPATYSVDFRLSIENGEVANL